MDNLNKTISFILGLVVVLVFLAVVTGRLNLKGKLPFLTKSAAPTPLPTTTPTPVSTIKISPTVPAGNQVYGRYQKTLKTIPAAGLPTIVLPILVSSLIVGLRLRRTKK